MTVQADETPDWYMGSAPDCDIGPCAETPVAMERLRGRLTCDAPLAKLVWFKTGGHADWLFEPADLADLKLFLDRLDGSMPVMALGLGSNLIVRDGGIPGVVIKLGKPFAQVTVGDGHVVACGGAAHGILVASVARDAGIAGLEFMRGIPGTVGGFVRMNGGAYGREVSDVLIDCDVVLPTGECVRLPAADLGYTYRHSALPEGATVVAARFQGRPGEIADIAREMDRIADQRERSQPLRTRPVLRRHWQLAEAPRHPLVRYASDDGPGFDRALFVSTECHPFFDLQILKLDISTRRKPDGPEAYFNLPLRECTEGI